MGHGNAEHATNTLLAGDADHIISFGMAGAISPLLKPGDLLLPEKVLMNGDTFDIHSPLREHLQEQALRDGMRVSTSPLLSVNRVLTSSPEKETLSRQTGGSAVDMETAIIIKQARGKKIPAFAVRIIIDPLELKIPELALKHTNEFGELRTPSLLMALLRAPDQIPALIQIARAHSRATKTMRRIGREIMQTAPL